MEHLVWDASCAGSNQRRRMLCTEPPRGRQWLECVVNSSKCSTELLCRRWEDHRDCAQRAAAQSHGGLVAKSGSPKAMAAKATLPMVEIGDGQRSRSRQERRDEWHDMAASAVGARGRWWRQRATSEVATRAAEKAAKIRTVWPKTDHGWKNEGQTSHTCVFLWLHKKNRT